MSEEQDRQGEAPQEQQPEQLQSDTAMDAVNVRSEELQDVIGMIPHWIIRWGITVLFSVILLLFVGSWIFRYPDVVPATILITTQNPPATIVARSSGKIQHLLVQDNQPIDRFEYIAVLENTTNLAHILELKKKLTAFQGYAGSFSGKSPVAFSPNYQLGELQNSYEAFLKSLAEYHNYLQNDFYAKKIRSLEDQLQKQKDYCEQLRQQLANIEEDLKLAQNNYERKKKVFEEGIISKTELENVQSAYLQKVNACTSARTGITQAQMSVNRLDQELLDLRQQDDQQRKQLQLALKSSYDSLRSGILGWEYAFVIQSPLAGTVSFTKFWSVNQYVAAGEKVVSIVPQDKTQLVGRVLLPVTGSGKVKVGQKVRIKLVNFPFMEFGIVWGEIRSKSLLPVDNAYTLDVVFRDGLKTSYGRTLEFTQEMQGTAEIITENKRLIERFFAPFRSLFTQNPK